MEKFKVAKTPLPGLLAIEPHAFADERGFFLEFLNRDEFARFGLTGPFVQLNQSRSQQGVVRGLHYQINPAPMGKLVKCTRGKIFDVGVDLRKGSPTFGQWYGETLAGESHRMLYLPPGFAHGFLCLADDTDVIYACTGVYSPADERALLWNDPALGIKWPLDQVARTIISAKDQRHPRLADAETNFVYQP
ncbi:MAG: dTDP-4-dehydrorhamnose 3,5-epimerase [Candidatus Saganbacteria bacterium]|nr:dTDP-4-dehydrorhamnose 3,5-epimerase [Candidatus Saganbacteria bacterium]